MGLCASRFFGYKQMDMADISKFAVNRTVKVTGISEFLKNMFVKYFQRDNDFGPRRDVEKVFVCPDGNDCILVEFSEDQGESEEEKNSPIVSVKIDDTSLTVEPFNPSSTPSKDGCVSKVWSIDELQIEIDYENTSSPVAGKHHLTAKKGGKVTGAQKIKSDKKHRQEIFEKCRQTSQANSKEAAAESKNATRHSIFENTKVKLSPAFLNRIVGKNENKTAKEMLEKEEVDLDKDKGYLTGSWNAVLNVFASLYSLFYEEDEKTSTSQQATDTLSSSSAESGCDGCLANKSDIIVETLLIRYISTFHWEVFQELENVSKEIKFKISTPNRLEIVARDEIDADLFNEKYNKFIDFYQTMYPIMYQEVITVNPDSSVNSSITEIVSDTRVIASFCRETSKITVYGKETVVKQACRSINDRVRAGSKGPKNFEMNDRDGQLVHELSKKVKVIVYQGDIAEENADAIVNPANENLKHVGGTAQAILKRGGKTIQDESDDIMKQRQRPLQPGDVEITRAGELPCKFVVHTVGPRRSNNSESTCRKLLQKAVRESLNTASQNGAKTIAIPAISSGIFGVPVGLCAEVLFETVEEFAKAPADLKEVQEIRFVNIDKDTTQVFQKEMRKRYGDVISAGKKESNQNGFSTGKKGKTRNPNENPQNLTGNERKGNKNSSPGKKHPELNRNASTRTTVTYHQNRSYSEVTKGPTNPNDNDPEADTSNCSICLDHMTNPKKLHKCGHSFCSECIDNAFKHQQKCPICSEVYGVLTGNQPPGRMTTRKSSNTLPGFNECGTITITYELYNGTQGQNHPHPGRPYTGARRVAYLPDNREGQKVLKLLEKAFEQKLTFTIGRSSTSGIDDIVTWNDIHHKTKCSGGATNYGYPDPSYLQRVQEELAAKGIKE